MHWTHQLLWSMDSLFLQSLKLFGRKHELTRRTFRARRYLRGRLKRESS
jgi:hypothetical protein